MDRRRGSSCTDDERSNAGPRQPVARIARVRASTGQLAEADSDVVARGHHGSRSGRQPHGRSQRSELEEIIDGDEPVSDRVAQGPTRLTTIVSGRASIATGRAGGLGSSTIAASPPRTARTIAPGPVVTVDSRTPLDPDRDAVGWPWVLTTLQTAIASGPADRAWKPERDTGEGRRLRWFGDARPWSPAAGAHRVRCVDVRRLIVTESDWPPADERAGSRAGPTRTAGPIEKGSESLRGGLRDRRA